MGLLERLYFVLALCACIRVVLTIPTFESVTSWTSIGSLVPGLSYLEALGPATEDDRKYPRYVSIAAPHGKPGNVTVSRRLSPPLFYVHNSQLYYYHNMTTIFPMNVHNSTLTSPFPYQMMVGTKQEGIKGGHWRWQGTMLYYDRGTGTNGGVFYSCKDPTGGLTGLYMFLQPAPTPEGCTLFTVHSWSRDFM